MAHFGLVTIRSLFVLETRARFRGLWTSRELLILYRSSSPAGESSGRALPSCVPACQHWMHSPLEGVAAPAAVTDGRTERLRL